MHEVTPGVLIATSRRDTTTSTVVVHGNTALLVDPAWEPDELSDLADFLEDSGLRVEAGFATHAHQDHVLWHPGFGGAPRWTSPAAAELVAEHRGELVDLLGPDWPLSLMPLVGKVEALAENVIPWDGHRGPRSSSTTDIPPATQRSGFPSHACYWPATCSAPSNCPSPRRPGLAAYDEALTVLLPFVRQAAVLVPGHGHPTSDPMDSLGRRPTVSRWGPGR